MEKTCPKCGKTLPEDAAVCPDCGAPTAEEGRDAALFTQISAETEGWRNRERRKLSREEWLPRLLIGAAALVVVLTVVLIIASQAEARVLRAINAGRYEEAATIYWNDPGLAERGSERVDRAVLETAEKLTAGFAAHELDGDEAARDISTLSTIGRGGEQLTDLVERFRDLAESRAHMDRAKALAMEGNYLEARAEYLLVHEDDSDYVEARQKAAACLSDYGDRVIREADKELERGDYAEALRVVMAGEQALLDYEFYYEKLDQKHRDCAALLEENLLKRAAELEGNGSYRVAAELLQSHIEEFSLSGEALLAGYQRCVDEALNDDLDQAKTQADQLFDAGRYAEAFAVLDALAERTDIPAERRESVLTELERRFAELKINQARERFGGVRDNLSAAIAILREAMRIRELDDIAAYWEELNQYLPYSLATEDYIEKQGVIFRSTSSFDARNGVRYTAGWVWGDNGSELTFRLEGEYDRFRATFTVRRDDSLSASAWFELICDGEVVYTSPRLNHTQTQPIDVDVYLQPCERLTLRFHNDYKVSGTESGYCYHGLCSPVLTKTMP
ncbi:MAG: NPCBM/NEW2 domain-containing protein [Oscillospiraceae bacterium]|nr:NPCBM/NEW2 domain-containing protein [Oscillospiraceae bacterium]